MKCPNCGNEIRPGESFCGQCGTPVVSPIPPTNQTEMMSTPPPRGGMLNAYPAQPSNSSQVSFAPPSGQQRQQGASITPSLSPLSPAPPLHNNAMPSSRSGQQTYSSRPIHQQTGSLGQQQEDFYQDATEAIPNIPQNVQQGYAPNYSSNYAGQQQSSTPPASSYYPPVGAAPTQYGGQPGQHSFLNQTQGPQTPAFQAQGPIRNAPQPPVRQSGNVGVLIVSILLALALITIVGLGTLYVLHNQSTSNQNTATIAATSTAAANQVNATVTAGANATATAASVPTPSPTAAPDPTTVPSPTAVPTAAPDQGFAYCGQACLTGGYQTEYPNGWNLTPGSDNISIQFINPSQQDMFAVIRTPSVGASSASAVVETDLQNNYEGKSDYTNDSPTSTVVIGGETWVQSVATYQGDTQKERVEVFGTIHAGKSYVIEFQAPDAQFDQVNRQYFSNMTNRFQFQ